MQGDQQQAYDRGSTIFSPDGRLYQVEYAREAVARGATAVGVRTDEGLVLAAERRLRSPLLEAESIEKLHRVDDHLAVASAGHVADARHLVDVARRAAQRNRYSYDEPLGVETLSENLGDYAQQYTHAAGARPFGTALLLGGVEGDEPRLFELDVSGSATEWRASAVGGDAEATREFLASEHADDLGLDGGLDLALRALAHSADELRPELVDAGRIPAADAAYEQVPAETLAEHLDDLDVADIG